MEPVRLKAVAAMGPGEASKASDSDMYSQYDAGKDSEEVK